MEKTVLSTYEASLVRCSAHPRFFERFYELFLASSPRVAEKFAHTDFERQRQALQASLHLMTQAASDEANGPDRYLRELADHHSRRELNVGAEFYDYWLDSLLATVKELDPACDETVCRAWERVMMIGIGYMLSRY